jgi:hypothetical protein
VKGLKTDAAPALLHAVIVKLEQKPREHGYVEALYEWLHALFQHKTADLLSDRASMELLGPIFSALEERTLHFEKLAMLRGKLDLLLQLNQREVRAVPEAAKYEAIHVLDENVEEDIPGVEVLDLADLKKASEMMADTLEPAEDDSSERSLSLPDVVEAQDEEEQDRHKLPELSDSADEGSEMEDAKAA